MKDDTPSPIDTLLEVMRRLRDPQTGCPWDIEQTFESIAPYTIEEAYEVADAIHKGDRDALRGELGDLLLQVVYYAQMGKEEGSFTFNDITRAITEKMIHRHPHVFGDKEITSAEEQTRHWEEVKQAERKAATDQSALADVAITLPALNRAQKLQKRAARVGFDWPDTGGVLDKIVEETNELAQAQRDGETNARIADEYGDVLFTLAVLGQHLGIDAEQALTQANRKFERRFRGVEAMLAEQGRSPAQSNLEEMDAMWDAVKREERDET